MGVYLDFAPLPRPEPPEEVDLDLGPRGARPRWATPVAGTWLFVSVAILVALVSSAISHHALAQYLGIAAVLFLVLVLIILASVAVDSVPYRRLLRSLNRTSHEEDVAKLKEALKGRWESNFRATLLGILATKWMAHGQLTRALTAYGAVVTEAGTGGTRGLREATVLSTTLAIAYAGRCDDAEKWAIAWEQQVPKKRACKTLLARCAVAFHRRDFHRVLELMNPISASAGPLEARAIKAYALVQTGNADEGHRFASALQTAGPAQLAAICFASDDLKRFLLECGVDTASVEPSAA